MTSSGSSNSGFRTPANLRTGGLLATLVFLGATASTGCSAVVAEEDASTPLVLTTLTVTADFARQIGGRHVRVESLTGPGVDVHGYEPSPEDLRRAHDADLIVEHGLGIDAWLLDLLAGVETPRTVVTRDIDPMTIATRGDETVTDPHAWMSPANATRYVDVLERDLAALVPEHADAIARNAEAYRKTLGELNDTVASTFSTLPERQRILVTCEGAFGYLAREAGLEVRYLWPINSEQQVSPAGLAAVIDAVDERDVPAVFCESTVSADLQRRVADATQADYGGTLYVDSLSEPDGPVPTYEMLIRHDLAVISAGLGGDTP